MKAPRLLLPALIVAAALSGVWWLTLAAPTTKPETKPHSAPAAQRRGPDLGPEFKVPFSQALIPVREGADAERAAVRLEELLQRQRQQARPGLRLTPEQLAQQVADVERYIAENPDGEFTPGLRVEMGIYYRRTGRYTKSLEHWRQAWAECQQYADGNGKLLADRALAHLASLLTSLGRVEELKPLMREHQFRQFSDSQVVPVWLRAREVFVHMLRQPGQAYRCGPLALFNVAKRLQGRTLVELRHQASPETGFSLAEVQRLADQFNLNLVTAFREEGGALPVPAVVHWKENHYAAIVAERDGRYLVEDPTFFSSVWMDRETLAAEASGYFLIPPTLLPGGWRRVSPTEAAGVFGKGWPHFLDDDDGPECGSEGEEECCEEGGGPSGTGSGTNECGMATWKVHEPNVNLEVWDIPLHYKAAFGPDFVLKLQWRQRNNWFHNWTHFDTRWVSDLIGEIYYPADITSGTATMEVIGGDGFFRKFQFNGSSALSAPHYLSGAWAERFVPPGGSEVTILRVYYTNGAVDTYELLPGYNWYHLVSREDATGKAMTFTYDSYWARLDKVTMADGAEFNFVYGNGSYPNRITSITGPNGRSVSFTYSAGGLLTGITDAVGITSSFEYDATTYWLEKITTPYGDTTFDLFDAGACDWVHNLSCAGVDRAIVVTEPSGSQQVYAFYDNAGPDLVPPQANEMTGLIPASFSAGQIPDYSADSLPVNSLDTVRDRRNSHYWNRQQAAQLSTLDPANFTAADFRLSRTRHWLMDDNVYNAIRTISWELPPSPDGTAEAQPTFYDYAGKPGTAYVGDGSRPSVIARKMPDGTAYYRYWTRNARGKRTAEVERWVEGGTVKTRGRAPTYASGTGLGRVDSLLKVKEVGPSGELIFGYALHPTYTDQVKYATNGVGEVTTYDYDANRRITSRLTHTGLLSTYTYDGTSHRLLKVVDSVSGTSLRTNSYTWLNGYLRTHTDPYGMTRTFDYDFLGRLTKTTYPDTTTEEHSYTLPAYTGFNNTATPRPILDRVSFKDRLGNYWWTLPNRVRQVEKVIEPPKVSGGSGTETTVSYCGCGAPTAITRASNTGAPETTSFEYNYRGALKLVTLPDGAKFTNLFDSLGRLVERQDHYQKLTNTWDNLGRLLAQKNGAGLVSGAQFDLSDRVLRQTNANGVWFTNAWDNVHRLTVRAQPDGGKEYWGYTTGFPGATAYTNQVGDVTTWAYDASLRQTNETVVGVYTNSFVYNGADDLRELYDGKTQKTAWAYDLYSRVTNKVDHLNVSVLAYAYNANGWLTNRWSKQKGNTEYRYDPVGNLTNVNYPASADLVFEYDAFNRVVKDTRKGVITNTYTYHAGGQLATEATPQWASSTLTLAYTSRLRTSLTLAQPTIGNWTHSYTWDSARRLDTLTGSSGSFDYDYIAAATSGDYASRLVKKLTVPTTSAGPNITNLWDTTGRLTETKLVNGGTTFNRHAYVLNAAHQRTKQTRPDASYVDYTYDDAGQLSTALSYNSGGTPITTEQLKYGYDAAQNLTKRTNNTTVTTYTVNSLNQVTSDGGASWTHDNNGNRTYQPNGVGSYNYTYDDENQLVQAETDTSSTPTSGRWKTVWTYDARGRVRVREDYTWYTPGSSWLLSTTTRYLYDGMRVIQERNASNVPQVTYTRGLDLAGSWERAGGIGGLLARTAHSGANGGTYTPAFYHADGNGNVTYLLKMDQTMGATYTFDPYGRQLASSGTLANANTYRFSSKELMVASGLYYYGFRFYDPNTQRWLNRDPIEEDGGINLYGFVFNRPTISFDPHGHADGLCGHAIEIIGGVLTLGPTGALDEYVNGRIDGQHFGNVARGRGGRKGVADSPQWYENAARHAYWQATLTQKYGALNADLVGIFHESGSMEPTDTWVDKYNNKIGQRIGRDATSPADMTKKIFDALDNGELITNPNDPRIPERLRGGVGDKGQSGSGNDSAKHLCNGSVGK